MAVITLDRRNIESSIGEGRGLTSGRPELGDSSCAVAHNVVSLQLDPVKGIGAQALQKLPRPTLLGLDLHAGVVRHLPFACDPSCLAVLDQIHVDGLAVVGWRQPAEFVLVIERRLLVLGARRSQDLGLVRRCPARCGLFEVGAPVTQTDVVPRREAKLVSRQRLQAFDDVDGT